MNPAGNRLSEIATTESGFVVDLPDASATAGLARKIAPLLRQGDVVALSGDLGAGKTCLARAIIRTLGDPEESVPSPTFTLVQTYSLPQFELWHFDLYRLQSPSESFEIGIEEAFADGVSLIEWPDRLGPWLPENALHIALTLSGDGRSRRAMLRGGADWIERLSASQHG